MAVTVQLAGGGRGVALEVAVVDVQVGDCGDCVEVHRPQTHLGAETGAPKADFEDIRQFKRAAADTGGNICDCFQSDAG